MKFKKYIEKSSSEIAKLDLEGKNIKEIAELVNISPKKLVTIFKNLI